MKLGILFFTLLPWLANAQTPADTVLANQYYATGDSLTEQGKYDESTTFFQKAQPIYHQAEDWAKYLACYNAIATNLWQMAEYDSALSLAQIVLTIGKQQVGSKHTEIANAYENIGIVNEYRGKYDTAMVYYRKVLEMRTNIFDNTHLSVADAYENIGIAYEKFGQYDSALFYHQKALRIRQLKIKTHDPLLAGSHNNIGLIYEKKGQYDEALIYYHKGIIANYLSFSSTITSSTPYSKGYINGTQLLESLTAKANILRKVYQKDSFSIIFNTIQSTYQLSDSLIGQLEKSFKTYQDKIALAKKARQAYEGAIDLYLLFDSTSSANESAFYYAEKNKASTLTGVLTDLQAKKISDIPDSLLAQEQLLRDQRSSFQSKQREAYLKGDSILTQQYQNELFTVNQRYDSLIETFEQQYPQYYQLKHTNEVISVDELQSQLTSQTALLEYFVGDSATYAFTVTTDSVYVTTLPNDSTRQNKIQELRTLLSPEGTTQFNNQRYTQLAYVLYQAVVAPALANLPTTIRKLQIVPDGELGYLPFELLLTANTSTRDYRSLPYLMRDYVISYGYSATWLYQTPPKRKQPTTQQYLAFAPGYEDALDDSTQLLAIGRFRDQVLPLEWNQQEARTINQHLSGRAYVGSEAQERYFKEQASQSQILHLAMHALVDDQNPMYSRLVFSSNSTDSLEDGYLNAYELYNMEIPADLAVLSACETGYGKLERGEGIMSLARAFAYAGCPSLVMSHWTVDDQSTAQLMNYFYELLAEGFPKDKALHQAKLRFLDETDVSTTHPFFWGSFVVMGDTSPIDQPHKQTVWYYALTGLVLLGIATIVYTKQKV